MSLRMLVVIAALLPALPTSGQALPEGAVRRFDREVRPSLFAGCTGNGVFAVAFSPDGRSVATGHGNDARVWDVASGRQTHRFPNRSTVHAVAFSPDGHELAWGGFGNSFALVNLKTGETKLEPDVGICVGFFAGFTGDGRRLLSDGSGGRGGRHDSWLLWDLESGEKRLDVQVPGSLWCGAMTPDGKTVITGGNQGRVIFWDAGTGKRRGEKQVEGGAVLDLALTADGATVAVVSSAPTPYVETIEVETLKTLVRIPHSKVVRAVAISPDGGLIATGGNDPGLRLFDGKSGREVAKLPGHGSGVSSLAFSPDGQRLISGGFWGSALLWKVPEKQGSSPRKR